MSLFDRIASHGCGSLKCKESRGVLPAGALSECAVCELARALEEQASTIRALRAEVDALKAIATKA